MNKADGGGLRYNNGKNRLDLVPAEWIWGLGALLTKGAEKYDTRNWERGMSWGTMVGCAQRHLYKFICGERVDSETGCHHLAMAAWNILALMTYDIRQVGVNDLVGKMEYLRAVEPKIPASGEKADDGSALDTKSLPPTIFPP